MNGEDPHKEFMLAALRVASARCKLMDNEITSIGTALKHDLISPDMAVKWAHDMNVMFLVEPIPGAVGAIAMAEMVPNGVGDVRTEG
jgi:hypothetical protein